MKPVFLISLPRSGSTMAQRILASHPDVATVSEPWVLLPLLYMTRSDGVYAEYSHRAACQALNEFTQKLPAGVSGYKDEVRKFVLGLYRKAATSNAKYFLDKTPRYTLVAKDLLEVFPDAKIIFLWRNPLAVIASLIDSLGDGHWRIYDYKVDLYAGLECALEAQDSYGPGVCSVNYEKLIISPGDEWRRIFSYLELSYDNKYVESFTAVKLGGSMGDPTGTKMYTDISSEPLNKWMEVLGNPFRRAWARRYLVWIGGKRLSEMGYSIDQLLSELDAIDHNMEGLGNDLLRATFGFANGLFETRMLMKKLKQLPDLSKIRSHA